MWGIYWGKFYWGAHYWPGVGSGPFPSGGFSLGGSYPAQKKRKPVKSGPSVKDSLRDTLYGKTEEVQPFLGNPKLAEARRQVMEFQGARPPVRKMDLSKMQQARDFVNANKRPKNIVKYRSNRDA